MGKTIMSKIKWLLALCAVTVLALVGGIFSLNTKAEAKAEESITITQVQFRTSGENCYFFLRMDGQTDYATANQWHDPAMITNTNILDKVTVYFMDGSATLREVWTGVNCGTYIWGESHTLVFPMQAEYKSNMGIGARIDAGAEIPMLDGTKLVTAASRSFWTNGTGADMQVNNYAEGYKAIETTLAKVHLRGAFLIGLGEGNDWDGKGEALPTQAVGADGTNNHSIANWLKLYLANFTSKIKLHVKATDTWVTLGDALNPPADAPQFVMIYNGWGETGGIVRIAIDTAYNGTTVDKILFEKGCELPSYSFNGDAIAHTVHVLDAEYLCTSNDMSVAEAAVSWSFEKFNEITYLNEDGSVYTTQKCKQGDAIVLPAIPEKAGYEGAWTMAGGEAPTTMPANDITLQLKYEEKVVLPNNITQVQFRTSGESCFFFLRMDGLTDYTELNQWHDPSMVTSTNLLDKVHLYFLDGSATLREAWTGESCGTYIWGESHSLVFQMKSEYKSDMGVGARIDAGAEIPMLDGTKKVTEVTRTFWSPHNTADNAISNYTDGYNVISTSLAKLHLRGRINIGLGAGNDWVKGEGSADSLPTQVPGADGTNAHSGTYWRKMLACNFLGKVKLHVKETDTWVTLGSILNYNPEARQLTYYFNNWGETGGTMQIDINTAYNGTTIDKVLFEKGCEFPSYDYLGNADMAYTVQVLDKAYLCTSNDMSNAEWAIDWAFNEAYEVTFNGANLTYVAANQPVAYPTALSETKPDDENGSYTYNWFLNGELYDFSTPVTGNINLTSDGSFTLTERKYTLTYLKADGSVYKTEQYTKDADITLAGVPFKAGYEGVWTVEEGEVPTTMPASDVTLKAAYTKNFVVTEIQFRSNGEEYYFFLRFNATDYVTPNQVQDASFITKTNLLDNVTIYMEDGIYTLREIWDGVTVTTYRWGDTNTLTFKMKSGFISKNGMGARIAAGTEIPMVNGEVATTDVSRTFWTTTPAAERITDFAVQSYIEGYTEIETTIEKVHLRGVFLVGLGEGNDWNGKGEALPTQVKDANGSSAYANLNWSSIMMYMVDYQTKIKLHVKETDTWVTLGEAMDTMGNDPQWMFVFNGWGEEGGIMRISINSNLYNGTTVDKILFEKGCELPSYDMVASASAGHIVHVLTEDFMLSSNDMSNAEWAVDWTRQYKVTFNGENATYVNANATIAYPTDLSVNKDATAEYTYVYNWFLNGEIYNFETPITGDVNLTSDGTYTEIPNEYTVTYYALDGATVLYKDVFAYGSALTVRPVDSIEGYVDCGWAYLGAGEVPTTMPACDIAFQVQGTAKTYTLSFGETNVTVTYAQAIGELPAVPAQVGYSGVWTIDGEVVTAETIWRIDADKAAEAVYTANTYTLSFVVDGETVETLVVTYDAAIGTLPTVPAKAHYVGCWMMGEETLTASTVWTNASDMAATAAYNPVDYTVTFDGENATSYAYGSLVVKPADPTKESTAESDYTFIGWYNGEVEWNFDTDVVAGDMQLVAKFAESKRMYTVSFNVTGNDAIELEAMTVAYGTNVDLTKILDDEGVAGYIYSISVNGVEKASIKVVADVTVDITFTEKVEDSTDDGADAPTDEPEQPAGDGSIMDQIKDLAPGCSGVVGGLSMAIATLTVAGAALLCKRKED